LKSAESSFSDEPVYGNVEVKKGEGLLVAYSIGVKVAAANLHLRERATIGALPLPTYPAALLNAAITGKCEVCFELQADGSLSNVRVESSTHAELSTASLLAVKQWRFEPLKQNGGEKVVKGVITFVFSIYSD